MPEAPPPGRPDPRLAELRRALAGPLPGTVAHQLAWPAHLPIRGPFPADHPYRIAAVLLLLVPRGGRVDIPLVERPTSMSDHPGQIACPGGRLEPGEPAGDAALRELEEELGVGRRAVELLGELSTVWIPASGFQVRPFIGWIDTEPTWTPDPREVSRLLFAPADEVAFQGPTSRYLRVRGHEMFEVPAYPVEGGLVWGATALVLAEFGEIWKSLSQARP